MKRYLVVRGILLDKGADVNGRDVVGDTPLISAAWVGASDIVRFLIERGADVNFVGSEGKTALGLVNADLHGAAKIMRKSKQKFDFERLCVGLLASPLRIRVV